MNLQTEFINNQNITIITIEIILIYKHKEDAAYSAKLQKVIKSINKELPIRHSHTHTLFIKGGQKDMPVEIYWLQVIRSQ